MPRFVVYPYIKEPGAYQGTSISFGPLHHPCLFVFWKRRRGSALDISPINKKVACWESWKIGHNIKASIFVPSMECTGRIKLEGGKKKEREHLIYFYLFMSTFQWTPLHLFMCCIKAKIVRICCAMQVGFKEMWVNNDWENLKHW